MNHLVLACLLMHFTFFWDLSVRFHRLFWGKRFTPWLEKKSRIMCRRLFQLARVFMGMEIHFDKGRIQLPRQAMIIANHQSLIDIPALIVCLEELNLRFAAK